jgi:hypothetical protein
MKLLFCPDCDDVVRLRGRTFRQCACGAARGRYVDDETVEVEGVRVEVLGIDGHGIRAALSLVDTHDRRGPDVLAWMFQHGAEHVRRLGVRR